MLITANFTPHGRDTDVGYFFNMYVGCTLDPLTDIHLDTQTQLRSASPSSSPPPLPPPSAPPPSAAGETRNPRIRFHSRDGRANGRTERRTRRRRRTRWRGRLPPLSLSLPPFLVPPVHCSLSRSLARPSPSPTRCHSEMQCSFIREGGARKMSEFGTARRIFCICKCKT